MLRRGIVDWEKYRLQHTRSSKYENAGRIRGSDIPSRPEGYQISYDGELGKAVSRLECRLQSQVTTSSSHLLSSYYYFSPECLLQFYSLHVDCLSMSKLHPFTY